jgi:hypothetical protein
MVPGSLGNNGIFEKRHAGRRESHGEILLGGAKGVGRRDGCSVGLRFQKMGVKAAVAVYTGSLSSVLENYSRGDEISLVMREHPQHQHIGDFL